MDKVNVPLALHVLRQSAAHILADALQRTFGENQVKLGTGTSVQDGFYYDVSVPRPLSTDDLEALENTMRQIIAEDLPMLQEVVQRSHALEKFAATQEIFQEQWIHCLPEDALITLCHFGHFTSLSEGTLLSSTGGLQFFKLLSVGGVYWQGDAGQPMLQRVYGTAFFTNDELSSHLAYLEEAKRRDHRKLAKELDLFLFSEEAPGMPFYLKNGLILRNQLESYERSLQALDYEEVRTPLLMNERLWTQSGHSAHYEQNMYRVDIDNEAYRLKPMSCPGHMLIFKSKTRSYRDLPLRMAEYGICHRHELSGTLGGLLRVRSFTQDDAHIFVHPAQIQSEIARVMSLLQQIYQDLGFSYRVELSTRPDNSLGNDELWHDAEAALQNVLTSQGIPFQVNEGDGAFYGPKIDFHVEDALKRSWQCGTIQLDFQLPERFDLHYTGEDGQKHRPVVIHRAIFGSMERFIGILIEHFAGAFPLWLAPVQVRILPISEAQHEAVQAMRSSLQAVGIRAEVDARNEKIGYRIRQAQVQKIPYTLVIGEKEMENGLVSVRAYGQSITQQGHLSELTVQWLEEISQKRHG